MTDQEIRDTLRQAMADWDAHHGRTQDDRPMTTAMTHTIERVGRITGRWPRYRLIVDGVDLGDVRRTVERGADGLAGAPSYDGWAIHGTTCASRAAAEERLIARAIRFGHIVAR